MYYSSWVKVWTGLQQHAEQGHGMPEIDSQTVFICCNATIQCNNWNKDYRLFCVDTFVFM